jgi:hypothetical protein
MGSVVQRGLDLPDTACCGLIEPQCKAVVIHKKSRILHCFWNKQVKPQTILPPTLLKQIGFFE